MRPLGTSLAEVKQPFIDAQNALKNGLDNIVIVGGGSVGIEYAGGEQTRLVSFLPRVEQSQLTFFFLSEIIAAYPKKSVTLVAGAERLLNDDWPIKLSNKLEAELKSRNVKVVYGERIEKEVLSAGKGTVSLKDGTVIEGEFSEKKEEGVRNRRLSSRLIVSFDSRLHSSWPRRQRYRYHSQHQDRCLC